MNRLRDATSPYLLQHADNPVDWWEWGDEAFAEARRAQRAGPAERRVRRLPLVPRDGARVVRGRGDRGVPQRALRQRQGRPRGAARRRRGLHAGDHRDDRPRRLADDRACSTTTAARSSPAPTSPTGRGTGSRRSRQVLHGARPRPGATAADDVRRVGRRRVREHLAPAGAPLGGGAARPRTTSTPRSRTLRAEFDPAHGGFGGAPKFPPSMVLEFLLRHAARTGDERARRCSTRPARRWPAAASTTSSAAASRATRSTPRWVVPHFEKMLYDNAQLLGVYARWGGPLGDRVAARPPTSCSASCAPPRAASPPRWTPTARATRAGSTSGRPRSSSRCSAPDDGAWAAQAVRGHRGRHLRARHLDAAAAAATPTTRAQRLDDVRHGCSPPARPRVRPGPRRQGGRRLERAGDRRPVRRRRCCSAEPEYVDAAVAAGELLVGVHLVDGRLRAGLPRRRRSGAHAGVLEDHGCVAAGFLALLQAHRRRGLARARRGCCSTPRSTRFRADDGGFFDTAADAEALVARPRDPSDNASPSGLSATVHALVDVRRAHRRRAATARRPRRRSRPSPTLAERAPRFAGWSLAAAEAMLDGPARDRGGRPGRCRPRRPRAPRPAGGPGRSWSWPTGPRDDVPLLAGRDAGRRPPRGVRLPRPGLRAPGHRPRRPALTDSGHFVPGYRTVRSGVSPRVKDVTHAPGPVRRHLRLRHRRGGQRGRGARRPAHRGPGDQRAAARGRRRGRRRRDDRSRRRSRRCSRPAGTGTTRPPSRSSCTAAAPTGRG